MDMVMQGIPGVACYIHDNVISMKDEWQHPATLEELFKMRNKHGFWIKQDKRLFLTPSVEYLGHFIDLEDIHPLPSKVTAIVQAPTPTNFQELQSFLGSLNYSGKFIPKSRDHCSPPEQTAPS